ncbi:MAG: hypothetical protein R3C52_07385 [Hyphomonadaceae bacterium]
MVRRSLFSVTLVLMASAFGRASAQPPPVKDIEVSLTDRKAFIRIDLADQPAAATTRLSPSELAVDLLGVKATPLSMKPADTELFNLLVVTPSNAEGTTLVFHGTTFDSADATIYRNAVVVEGHLANPRSRPAPSAAQLAGLGDAACTGARNRLSQNAWDLEALGVQALCRYDAGEHASARADFARLASIDPDDWRAATGHGLFALADGERDVARVAFMAAADKTSDPDVANRLRELARAPYAP